MNPFTGRSIVVPVDLSEASDRALAFAKELATEPKQIIALHVGLPYTAVEPPYMYLIDEQVRCRELKESVRQRYEGATYDGIRIEVRYGDPGSEIASFANEVGAGLIIMPSHGRSGLAHLLIGSVAERVIRYAPCPVLVLRGLSARQAVSA
ncbi:MAG TPA: universal stress protein [Lacipirellulaceae bacterium]|nr:universal stress protein [Lacipirellulaceae bacterium]